MDRTFWDMAEPSEWEIDGKRVRMLFTMRAASRLEALLQASYEDIIFEMLQTDAQGSTGIAPMRVERQAAVVMVLMQEGGEDVTAAQLMKLHMRTFSALARAAQAEMLLKLPRGGKKKVDPPPPGAGDDTFSPRENALG